jgi:acyl dehydratase
LLRLAESKDRIGLFFRAALESKLLSAASCFRGKCMDKPKTIKDLYEGEVYSYSRSISKELIRNFAQTTGYLNPIHLDEVFAKKTVFGNLVGQGSLTVAILFGTLGTLFPGVGTIPLSQTLRFVKPVLADDEITIRLKVLSLDQERNRVNLETVCVNQRGEKLLTGEALVLAPR